MGWVFWGDATESIVLNAEHSEIVFEVLEVSHWFGLIVLPFHEVLDRLGIWYDRVRVHLDFKILLLIQMTCVSVSEFDILPTLE